MIQHSMDVFVVGLVGLPFDGKNRDLIARNQSTATSSCVESGLEAVSITSAPPACKVVIKFAVSVVTCKQAETRTPCKGFSFENRSRIRRRTGISRSAHSMRKLPPSASFISLTSYSDMDTIPLFSWLILSENPIFPGHQNFPDNERQIPAGFNDDCVFPFFQTVSGGQRPHLTGGLPIKTKPSAAQKTSTESIRPHRSDQPPSWVARWGCGNVHLLHTHPTHIRRRSPPHNRPSG